jgi:CHAT domain-containing protein
MDEKRYQEYLNLIQALLSCPNGQEEQILDAHANLIDAGLVQTVIQVAEVMKQRGNSDTANWLQNFSIQLNQRINNLSRATLYLIFLMRVMELIEKNQEEPSVIYSLLENNLDKLDDTFIKILHTWATSVFSKAEKDLARLTAAIIVIFSNRIRDFPLGKRLKNLEIALTGYETVLMVFSSQNFPEAWAEVQHNLGTVYRSRSVIEERSQNLERAIHHYKKALQIRTYETFPQDWADTQNNLGNVYKDRGLGDRSQNLEWAIYHYKEALRVITHDESPQKWAMIQHNLGVTYLNRLIGEQWQNLDIAIDYYQLALQKITYDVYPQQWSMIQHNLGVAYRNRITGEKAQNLELAIQSYKLALQIRSHETLPQDWVMTQICLGSAYFYRLMGDQSQNIEYAIHHFNSALQVCTPEILPQYWADIQNNLANAYRTRLVGEKTQNLEIAINYYQAALQIRTKEALPELYARTLFNLGLAYFEAKKITNAHTSFTNAVLVIESLRDEIVSGDKIKQKLAEEWNKLYCSLVEVCLELDNYAEAIEYVERSKTKNLVELILTRDITNIFPSEIASQLEKLHDEIEISQAQIQNSVNSDSSALLQHIQHLRYQRNNLQDSYLLIGNSFKFKQFQKSLNKYTVIVEFYITGEQLLIFIFTCQTLKPLVWRSASKNFKKFERWVNGYLRAYNNHKCHWQRRLTTRLHLLAKILHIDEILEQIPEEYNQLILIPHRYLHLFPLHALPISSQPGTSKPQILMARFPKGVRYAPSCQLLQLAQTRKRPNFTHLFAIQNPTEDLTYADLEVAAIQSYFDSANILEKAVATKAAVDDTPLNKVHCVHFSCHGYFNPNPGKANKSALILANAQLNPIPPQLDPERHLLLADGTVLDLDKCLTLDAIFSLKFQLDQCRLVVLSACETGLIDFRNISDEYIGLVSGFLFAGTPTVVSSQWAVDQVSTAFLLIKFYENLKNCPELNEGDVAFALQNAQNWLWHLTSEEGEKFLEKIQPQIESLFPGKPRSARAFKVGALKRIKESGTHPFADPFYWAAFITTGF